MPTEKFPEPFRTVPVIEPYLFIAHVFPSAHRLKTVSPFVRLAGYNGAMPEIQQAAAAPFQQLFRRHAAAAVVVRRDAGDAGTKIAVKTDIGEIVVNAEGGIVGKADNAVHPVLLGHPDKALFRVHVAVGDGENHTVAPPGQRLADVFGQSGKKGIDNIRNNQRHRVGFVGFQSPGVAVHLIAEFPGGVQHPLAVTLPNRDLVEHFGDCPHRNPGFPRHIFHGGNGHDATSLLMMFLVAACVYGCLSCPL